MNCNYLKRKKTMIEELQQKLKELYQQRLANPKNQKIRAEYNRILDELDKAGQLEPLPF